MTYAASLLLKTVALDTLQDPTGDFWTIDELVRALNDTQRQILELRPDALAVTESVPLAAGVRQTLPTGGAKLLKVLCNTGTKTDVVLLDDWAILNACTPGWRNQTGVTEILHYSYDERQPTVFEVFPPAAGSGASLDAVFAKHPADIGEPGSGQTYANVTGNISVRDIFANALRDGILWRAYSKESDVAPNQQRALLHQQAFATGLGVEIKATVAASPRSAT